MMKEKQNETLYPKRFYAKHFCSGVAGYLDENFLVPLDAMKQMNPTFEGKPVFVGHRDNSQDKLDDADGYIVKSFYNEVDGWLWCEFLATTQQAIDACENGQAVSNAYIPVTTRGAGVYNGLSYDRELVEGVFTHLAIVPNPRYKDSVILSPDDFKVYQESKQNELKQLKNSVEEKQTKQERETKTMIKFWKKQEVENSDDVMGLSVELPDGTSVAIADMVKEVQNSKKNEEAEDKKDEDKKEEPKVNMDTKVEVDGSEMSLKELVDAYISSRKKNEDDKKEEDKKEEEKQDACSKKKNEETEEEKKKEEDKESEKSNSMYMEALLKDKKNASDSISIQTTFGAVELGKSRYGSSK